MRLKSVFFSFLTSQTCRISIFSCSSEKKSLNSAGLRGRAADHGSLAWDDLIISSSHRWLFQAMCCAMTPKRTMMKLPGNKCGLPIKESSCPCVYQRWEEFEISFAFELLGIFDTFQAFFQAFGFWYFLVDSAAIQVYLRSCELHYQVPNTGSWAPRQSGVQSHQSHLAEGHVRNQPL